MNAQNRVMFVDDEEGVRLSWNRYLTQHGFDVSTAEDGAKAIRQLKRDPVDVVVADLKMPTVDGVELLEWIHDRQPETRFILLTGYGNEDVENRVRELGAFEYLNKPISPDTLAAVVTAASHLKLTPEITQPVDEPVEAAPEVDIVAADATVDETKKPKSRMRAAVEMGLGLVLAPILGLLFIMFLPIVGFAALFWVLGQALWQAFKPVDA